MKENKEIQDKEQQEQEQNKEQENNQNGEIQSENKNEGEENIQDNKEENKVEQESQEKNKDKAQSTEIKNEKKEEEKNEENKIEDSDNEKEPKYNPNKIYLEDDQDEIINIEKETKKKENKKKEKNDKNIVDKKFILRRSHCLNKNRVQELEKKEEEEEEKKKKEDEEIEENFKPIILGEINENNYIKTKVYEDFIIPSDKKIRVVGENFKDKKSTFIIGKNKNKFIIDDNGIIEGITENDFPLYYSFNESITNGSYLFKDVKCFKEIDLSKMDSSKMIDVSNMLKILILKKFTLEQKMNYT